MTLLIYFTLFQYLCDARGDQGSLLRQHHQKTKVQILFRNNPTANIAIKFHLILSYIPREGTGIQKFKRSKWSATDESPPKKKKTETDSGTAHFTIVIYT